MRMIQEALMKVTIAERNLSEAVEEMKDIMNGYGPTCYWQFGAKKPEIRCYRHWNSSVFNEPCGGPPQSGDG